MMALNKLSPPLLEEHSQNLLLIKVSSQKKFKSSSVVKPSEIESLNHGLKSP